MPSTTSPIGEKFMLSRLALLPRLMNSWTERVSGRPACANVTFPRVFEISLFIGSAAMLLRSHAALTSERPWMRPSLLSLSA